MKSPSTIPFLLTTLLLAAAGYPAAAGATSSHAEDTPDDNAAPANGGDWVGKISKSNVDGGARVRRSRGGSPVQSSSAAFSSSISDNRKHRASKRNAPKTPHAGTDVTKKVTAADSLFASVSKVPCNENGVVHAWCSNAISNSDLACAIDPASNMYACRCDEDTSHCPTECIQPNSDSASVPIAPFQTAPHSIVCRGIPEDEPNYILVRPKEVTSKLPLHHCENNALVANWCNEGQAAIIDDRNKLKLKGENKDGNLDCLLLPALDEYVCTCYGNRAACPQDCVNGEKPDRVSAHAIRCSGIPQDTPNYVLVESKHK
uniref:Uncharacterized protein n=1 Tax=Craspedostauros australis TaxID=1486917 RepID=A0A7R9WQJ9_9STRA|mmetsp:Transcript_15682/g.43324  ORF Transcript_15682/g.43324 Transcript_15682/m.43324 type:complete len:317 (+) Transcript_15682:87-1037(+)